MSKILYERVNERALKVWRYGIRSSDDMVSWLVLHSGFVCDVCHLGYYEDASGSVQDLKLHILDNDHQCERTRSFLCDLPRSVIPTPSCGDCHKTHPNYFSECSIRLSVRHDRCDSSEFAGWGLELLEETIAMLEALS